jgi:pimeloyl-ACP methyl ester carboxylesterase
MQQSMKKYLLLAILFGFVTGACGIFDEEPVEEPVEETGGAVENGQEAAVYNPSEAGNDGSFEVDDCPFDIPSGYDIECGYLTVPENRTVVNSPTIELAVAIVYAQNQQAAESNAPVLYLAGGHGGSALYDFAVDPESWNYLFLESRDLILVDQRGTGHSLPTLDCPEFQTVGDNENPDELCYDRLVNDGIDISAYNTRENAADIAALREALEIPEWNILGISYGTRLALEVMRSHPQGIRAVILDSVFPPNADTPVDEVYSVTDALTELYADCARDEFCQEWYPDLENIFLDTVQRLNEDETAPIFGDDLVFALSSAFSDTSLIPLLPYVIYEVANDNYDALDEISAEDGAGRRPNYQDGEDFSDSEGMYNAVICYDEYSAGDYDRVESAVVGTIPAEIEGALLQNTFDLTNLCAYWNPQESVDNRAVSSGIPSLILSGQYDVATPPRWAALTAETLSNDYLFEFPGSGHSLLSSDECAIIITADFLDNPNQEPDSGCITGIEWPYFE